MTILRLTAIVFALALMACTPTPNSDGAQEIREPTSSPAAVTTADSSVLRRQGTIRIALRNGDSLVLVDSTQDNENSVRYSYRGLIAPLNYHLLEVQHYEGGRYLLVNGANGWTTFSNGIPTVSPGGVRMAAGNVDLEAEYSPTTIQIWSVTSDSLVLEFEHDFVLAASASDSVWGPHSIEWVSPLEMRVQKEFRFGEVKGAVRVRRDAGEWKILPL